MQTNGRISFLAEKEAHSPENENGHSYIIRGVDPKKFGTTSHSWRGLPHKEGKSLALYAKASSIMAFLIELRVAKEAAVHAAS